MSIHIGTRARIPADGTVSKPFGSPVQASELGYGSGTYYFKYGSMAAALQMEYQQDYYDGRAYCCVFRSPYNSTATTNLLGNNIPMRGLLVQSDDLVNRQSVHWYTAQLYNSTSGANNDSAYMGGLIPTARRVILGGAGGHGIYTTSQNQCNWGITTRGAIGAGYNGSTCGSFPNGLIWGIGNSTNSSATYEVLSGTWSHWIWWGGDNSY